MKQQTNRRDTLISNPFLQKRMVIAISWPVVILISSNSAILSVLVANTSAEQEHWLYMPLLLGMVLLVMAGLFFLVNTVKVSNQILGPFVRIHRVIRACKDGEVQRIKLRKGDYLHELADEINGLLDWVDELRPTEAASAQAGPTRQAGRAPVARDRD